MASELVLHGNCRRLDGSHLSVAVAFCCSRSNRPATPSDAGGFLGADGRCVCSGGGNGG